MKASEAKAISVAAIRLKIDMEIDKVFSMIKKAARKGVFSITIGEPCSGTVIVEIQSLGYIVKRQGDCFVIDFQYPSK